MEYPFWPRRVFFEPAALEYPRGKELFQLFREKKVPIFQTTSHNRVRGIPGVTPAEAFQEGKQTLVVGVRRSESFQSCRPSAHYQLPLATGCPGQCRYCYLHTTLGKKPYLRVYINVEEVLDRAARLAREREPETTLFEGAAVSDPLFVEPFTGGVSRAISFFGKQEKARFRLVSKFTLVEPFLHLEHREHTRFRFSINTPQVIRDLEYNTPRLEERIRAARKIRAAGYPTGFLVAPLFLEGNWREGYRNLLLFLRKNFPEEAASPFTFELITHRFTARARKNIEAVFPGAPLDMDPSRRRYKYGQFGYGKYVYPPELFDEARKFFFTEIKALFPDSVIEYMV